MRDDDNRHGDRPPETRGGLNPDAFLQAVTVQFFPRVLFRVLTSVSWLTPLIQTAHYQPTNRLKDLKICVNEILDHLLPAAAVGGRLASLQHQLLQRRQRVFAPLDLGAQAAVPTGVAFL